MDIVPDKRKLVGLVEQAYEGKLCLPNFQRDFVWPREGVADLLRSVLRGYFIGSLLLLRCNPAKPPFAPVTVRGAKPTLDPRPEFLILDGQQRLSSLLYALTAPDRPLKDSSQRRWFFVDLDMLLAEKDNDEIVFDRTKRDLEGLDRIEVQFAKRALPATQLLRADDFMKWKDGFEDWIQNTAPSTVPKYKAEWRTPWTKAVSDFQNFQVPLVELPSVDDSDPDSIGRVCAIFEKLNSTGVELSVYDLLTARLYRSSIRLHDLWKESVKEHKRLAEWSEQKAETSKFGVLVLRTLALLRGLDPKPRILIDLNPEHFEKDWRRATAAMERALELITHVGADGFGVFHEKWLPGFGLLPILAALRAEIEDRKLGESARQDLRRWYWSNVFLERYSSAVESKSRKDYAEFVKYWSDGKGEPSVFSEARRRIGAAGFTIAESASHASSVYCGVFSLLANQQARDWTRAEAIALQSLEDHHIFPRAYLKRHGVEKPQIINSILNRTLISDETNAKIRDLAPAEYLASEKIFPSGKASILLNPHFMDEGALKHLSAAKEDLSDEKVQETYEAFTRFRETQILAKVREVCGINAEAINLSTPGVTESDQPPSELDDTEEVDEEEGTAGEKPWNVDGKGWHLTERCSKENASRLERLVALFSENVNEVVISWNQRSFVTLKYLGFKWAEIRTDATQLVLSLWAPGSSFIDTDLAKRLRIMVFRKDMSVAEKTALTSSVQVKTGNSPWQRVLIRIREDFDLENPEIPIILKLWALVIVKGELSALQKTSGGAKA